ncbi:hypothetical protein MATL_G00160210 [Megalops atlanticus]|uniref:Uncharacterized protein n=1 Tax=Megalops atlanticus TaxID=7932 RepID=A0A9D3PT34_MEGAT|nr:hypothetical protein MATL_G00160210 [Megalops atlanticus]
MESDSVSLAVEIVPDLLRAFDPAPRHSSVTRRAPSLLHPSNPLVEPLFCGKGQGEPAAALPVATAELELAAPFELPAKNRQMRGSAATWGTRPVGETSDCLGSPYVLITPLENMRRRTMFPETALYVANYILSQPRMSLYEPPYYSRYGRAPILDTFITPHQGKGGYWMSPQRYHLSGASWGDTHRRRVIFPGNTGFSDVISTKHAGSCHLHHTLVWKFRWRKLREQIRGLRR